MAANVLESYLVELGFTVNGSQFRAFDTAMGQAGRAVASFSISSVSDIIKFEVAAISAFSTIGIGVVALARKTALADQQYALLGQRMMMGKDAARAMSMATDALGASLDEIAYNPELLRRFSDLYEWNEKLGSLGGAHFDRNMVGIRDLIQEFNKLDASAQAFGRIFVSDLIDELGFGSGDMLKSLKGLNDFILTKIPEWSKEFSKDFAPALKDTWMILGDVKDMALDLGLEFTNLVGIFADDQSIEGATFNFKHFAVAVGDVAHGTAVLVHWLLEAERILIRFLPLIGGAAAGGGIGGTIGTVVGGIAGIAGGPAGVLAGAAAGGLAGTAIGTTTGAVTGGAVMLGEEGVRYFGHHPAGVTGSSTSDAPSNSVIAIAAKQLATQIGKDTGTDPAIIFAQWEHETKGFTNRGATDLNNLAGIKMPGGGDYRGFASMDDFGSYYESLLNRRYPEARGAKSPEDFAHALKAPSNWSSYYGDSEDTYANGMRRHMDDYGNTPSSVTNSVTIQSGAITVHVPPGTSADDAKLIVRDALVEHAQKSSRNTMSQTAGGWAA